MGSFSFTKRLLAVGLVLFLVLLSGPVYVQIVQHAEHHSHHQGASHATVLCSWMCAAGQVVESTEVALKAEIQPVASSVFPALAQPSIIFAFSFVSRGPPVLSA